MTERVKTYTSFLVAAASLLTALTTFLHAAAEAEKYQAAIQALAEVAFK